MNNKGFTLIELIATISLLGVLAIISFVSITGILSQSKVSDCETLVNNIKSAAKEYVSDNRYNVIVTATSEQMNGHTIIVSGTDKYIEIDAGVLIAQKYLSNDITNDAGDPVIDNPFDDTNIIPGNIKIMVYLNNDYSVYTGDIAVHDSIVVKNSVGNKVKCSDKKW